MNRQNTNENGAMTQTAPLFASSWLALFGWLYGYLYQRGADQGKQDRGKTGLH